MPEELCASLTAVASIQPARQPPQLPKARCSAPDSDASPSKTEEGCASCFQGRRGGSRA